MGTASTSLSLLDERKYAAAEKAKAQQSQIHIGDRSLAIATLLLTEIADFVEQKSAYSILEVVQ